MTCKYCGLGAPGEYCSGSCEVSHLRQQLAAQAAQIALLREALDVLEEFADTVAPFSSFWEEVWPKHQEALAATQGV